MRATYKDNAGHNENPLSEATATVADTPAPNPNHAGKIIISGVLAVRGVQCVFEPFILWVF